MSSSRIDSRILLESARAMVKKVKVIDKLSVDYYRLPKNQTLDLESFKEMLSRYPQYWPWPALELVNLDSHSYKHNKEYLPTSGDVSFVTCDTMASANKKLEKPKNNTWIMCPVCDPFKNANDRFCKESTMKNVTMNGGKTAVTVKSPIHGFYATLNSSYVHHMAECHGAYGKIQFPQPALGFMGPSVKLTAMCPHIDEHTGKPCLAVTEFSLKDNDGFKAYYRHYEHFHSKNHIIDHNTKLYKSTVFYSKSDLFVPLDMAVFDSITKSRLEKYVRVYNTEATQEAIVKALTDMKTDKSVSLDNVYNAMPGFFRVREQSATQKYQPPVPQFQKPELLFPPTPQSQQQFLCPAPADNNLELGMQFDFPELDDTLEMIEAALGQFDAVSASPLPGFAQVVAPEQDNNNYVYGPKQSNEPVQANEEEVVQTQAEEIEEDDGFEISDELLDEVLGPDEDEDRELNAEEEAELDELFDFSEEEEPATAEDEAAVDEPADVEVPEVDDEEEDIAEQLANLDQEAIDDAAELFGDMNEFIMNVMQADNFDYTGMVAAGEP